MSGSLQNRLLRYEAEPPQIVWENISRRIDEEFNPSDIWLSEKLESFSIPPPAAAWEIIQSELPVAGKPVRVIPIAFKRLAVAALVAGIIAVATVYILRVNDNNRMASTTPPTKVQGKEPKQNKPNSLSAPPATAAVSPAPKKEKIIIASVRKPTRKKNDNYDPGYTVYAMSESNEPYVATPETVNEESTITVSAPPIRNADGEIIMDRNLVSRPGQNYITVTSPNGNQTKLSNKFLNCLSYDCSIQFAQWREKLLSEAAFVPTANNFFDIFELKDIIQD